MTAVPLRLRLTLVFALAMAVVLAGAGWFLYHRVASDLSRALDQELRSRAQDVSALVTHGGSLAGTRDSLIEGGESFAELVRRDGQVVEASRSLRGRPLLSAPDLTSARRGPTFLDRPSVPGLDEPARMLAVPVSRRGERLVLVVGATGENRAETLRSLRAAFLVGGPLALALASLGGFVLAGAALRPIEGMRRRAAEISAASLDERLPVSGSRDELSRLGRTLNAMLARIEDGLARERRFVADASHELRTPLAQLKTELELALRHERSPDELKRAIRSAADETDRLARIADDLLLLARSEQGRLPLRLEPTDVSDVMATVAGRFAPRAAAEARELSVAGEESLVIRGDRLRLEQALANMVDNALRHGTGRVVLSSAAANGSVELHVLDDGPGFPPEFTARAFERFSQADDARGGEGSGLGLAIVDAVVRALTRAMRAQQPEPRAAPTFGSRYPQAERRAQTSEGRLGATSSADAAWPCKVAVAT